MTGGRFLTVLLLCGCAVSAAAEHIVGGGVSGDSDSGLSTTLFGDVGIGDKTHLSAALAHSQVDTRLGGDLDALYADVSLDHHFDPIGASLGVAYWGDADVLDSNDLRGSLYWRGERARFAVNVERRDFDLTLPATDLRIGREVSFDADGIGASLSFDITDTVDLALSGMDYDYSVNLRVDSDRVLLLRLLSVSRLSLINSLVDFRASATLGVAFGQQRFEFDAARWRAEVDGADTTSMTLRWLTPIGSKADIEFGIGHDDAESLGDATVFSVYFYLYGG